MAVGASNVKNSPIQKVFGKLKIPKITTFNSSLAHYSDARNRNRLDPAAESIRKV